MLITVLTVITTNRQIEVPDYLSQDFNTIRDYLIKNYQGFKNERNGTTAFDFKEIGIIQEQEEEEREEEK